MTEKRKVCISGIAGFIGSHIADALVKMDGIEVVGVDNLFTGYIENIAHIRDKIKFIQGDLTDRRVCDEACAGTDIVMHLAAIPSVPRSVKNPELTNLNNSCSTVSLLKSAVDNNVKRFIYSSSSSIYGDRIEPVKVETMVPNPKSPYAVSKLIGEYYLNAFNKTYGLDCISLRYFNVIGSKQSYLSQYAGVVPRFMTATFTDDNLKIFGDGAASRDYTSVHNVVDANILAMNCKNKLDGEAVNIACGHKTTVNELIGMIEKIHGKKLSVVYEKERVGDIKHSLADISLAKKLLGYESQYTLEDALKEAYVYYKNEVSHGT